MLVDICLPKFDIYQGTVVPNGFKSHKYWCPDFFQKKVLSNVRSKIHIVGSTGQSARA